MRLYGLLLLLLSALAIGAERPRTPAELYGELFERVQLERVFEDGKTFVDAVPRSAPEEIRAAYAKEKGQTGFDLRAFVLRHFEPPGNIAAPDDTAAAPDRARSGSPTPTDPSTPPTSIGSRHGAADPALRAAAREHIDRLWPILTRPRDEAPQYSSLLPLPHPYVVPGGRFREIYYWDSYFTMLGLEESGRGDLAGSMVANFAYLIDEYGHIPNGNRSYYLSRSQPPFFAAMVELTARRDPEAHRRYVKQLEAEYAFWMAGSERLARNTASGRVVRLEDGAVLNRYWDDRFDPREESFREDVTTARGSGRKAADVYRNLRAAAESGWDFSSRWLADGRRLQTIRTTDLVPVDLNALIYRLEQTLATAYEANGDPARARTTRARAWERRQAVHRYLWNEQEGAFGDFNWRERRLSPQLTAATIYPLYFGLATPQQSARVAEFVRRRLLRPDGLATTLVKPGSNGTPPTAGRRCNGLPSVGSGTTANRGWR
ncbi:MAG: alpha,alpha-trehalase [Gammaproteobacteria bacterium]|nr:alpha,alpha-trehalase [Gammaproteobacteria bacterium]